MKTSIKLPSMVCDDSAVFANGCLEAKPIMGNFCVGNRSMHCEFATGRVVPRYAAMTSPRRSRDADAILIFVGCL